MNLRGNLNADYQKQPIHTETQAIFEKIVQILPQNFHELSPLEQFEQVHLAADSVIKPPGNYIMVNADMTIRELFKGT